jgi:hypothetical protein
MTLRKRTRQEYKGEISFDPLSEPRTIPAGWQVAAFYPSEQTSQPSYELKRDSSDLTNRASIQNETSPDPVK